MGDYQDRDFKVFDLFRNQWALVSAGDIHHFGGCTIGWGSMGTLWTKQGSDGAVVTVYLHPARYTLELLKQNDEFTVSFFPEEYRKALGYMGSHSGRDEDKIRNAGLTLVETEDAVLYQEASMTFVCRKLYGHQFEREDLAPDIQEYYRNSPRSFPVNDQGQWEPHWMFVGEVKKMIEK